MNRYHQPDSGIDRHRSHARQQMLTHVPEPAKPINDNAYRAALLDFALRRPATHWVTLNSNNDLTLDTASRFLRRWRVEVFRRLHGQRFYRLRDDELTYFFGSIELPPAGQTHFHLACRVSDALHAKFCRVAIDRWTAIIPSGDVYIERVDPTEDDQRRVHGYALKWLDPNSALPFIDSRLYG